MTATPELGAALRHAADAQPVTDPARALARWQESVLPAYEVAPGSRPRRLGRAVAGVAAAVILAIAVGYVATRSGTPEDASPAELVGPSVPGVPLAVTAGMGWTAHRTADGWLVQHPAGWTVAEDLVCGTRRIVLVVMDASSADACARFAGPDDLGPLSGFVAVREVDAVPGPPPGTVAGPEVDLGGTVVGTWSDDEMAVEVLAGGELPRGFLQRIAVTLVAPRRAGEERAAAESLAGASETLAEALTGSHAVTEGFDGVLPRELGPAFQAWDLHASASLVQARLVEAERGVVFPRSLRVCSGTAAAGRQCGGEPEGPSRDERVIGGWPWACADSALAGQVRCRRTAADGTWVSFQATGTFTITELDDAFGSLSSDLTGAAWAEA